MNYDLLVFENGLKELDITLNPEQMRQFIIYYEFLMEKNKVMNLTAITEFEKVIVKHFLDSLSLVKVIDLSQALSILDLGTGAGFPGIPLKIVFPQLNILLMDSLQKRISFLTETIKLLGLQNIDAVHGRAEEMARKREYREKFDLCVSRAVANLSSLSEYCIPFVKLNGNFISYKSAEIEDEVNNAKRAIGILGGKIEEVKLFDLPGCEASRSLVKVNKVKRTPGLYPRKAPIPSKMPLA